MMLFRPKSEFERPTKRVWWISSPADEPWAGLRIAMFMETNQGMEVFMILGETNDRIGIRDWQDVSVREQWTKVQEIEVPPGYD